MFLGEYKTQDRLQEGIGTEEKKLMGGIYDVELKDNLCSISVYL